MSKTKEAKSYEFTLLLAGPDVTDGDGYDVVTEATDDQALLGHQHGSQFAAFDIEAQNFPDAVRWAFTRLDGAVPDLRVVRVEPEDLVNASEIAERTGRTRQSVSLLVSGKRGSGGFPRSVATLGSSSQLWKWSDVALWFANASPEWSVETTLNAEWVAAFNGSLEAREHRRRLNECLSRLEVQRAEAARSLPKAKRRQGKTARKSAKRAKASSSSKSELDVLISSYGESEEALELA